MAATITLQESDATDVVIPPTGQQRVYVDAADTVLKVLRSDGVTRPIGGSQMSQTPGIISGPTDYVTNFGELVRVDVSALALNVVLPTGDSTNTDLEVWVKLVSVATFTCTLLCTGLQTIDGASSVTLTTDYEWIILRFDGSNWMQLG